MFILACANSDAIFDYLDRVCCDKKQHAEDEDENVDFEKPLKKKKKKSKKIY